MIIINDEMLLNVFGKERVPFCKDLLMHSLKELIKREEYGKDITAITMYEPQWDPQKYVDDWMKCDIAKTEVAEYYKNLSFKGDDNMNKYETLLKKYGKLCREFEVYKENAEVVTVKLLETEKKYDELKKENDVLKEERGTLIKEGCYLHDVIEKRQEKCRRLISENDTLLKECNRIKKDRENLAQQVVYLKDKMKEKMDKIKQRDKQITELIRKNNVLKEERDCLLRKIKEETNESEKQVVDLIKERDELKQRLEHINAMSNLEWKFEVVGETETSKSPWDELIEETMALTKPATAYDELVTFCETRRDGGKDCFGCPNEIACDGINPIFRPAKWNENQKEDYNELIAMAKNKEDK